MVWKMLNVTNKANKLPSLIDKSGHQFFSFEKFSQNDKTKREFFFTMFLSLRKNWIFFATFRLSF